MEKLNAFHEVLDHTIEKTWSAPDYHSALSGGAAVLAEAMQLAGDLASQNLATGQTGSIENTDDFLLHFEWAEQAKNFLLLWRDILFEGQKAELLRQDKKVDTGALADLKARSLETIQAASASLKNFPPKKLDEIRTGRKGEKKQVEDWKLQTDPWPKYREQIGQLAGQCGELKRRHEQLARDSATMRDIRSLANETVLFCEAEINSFKETAGQADAFVEANHSEPETVANYLEDFEGDFKIRSYASSFTHVLDEKLNELSEKIQVPVSIDGGLVRQREIALRRQTRQWLESEILPILYEVWELTERTGNSLKMSLVNIRNRTIILSKNESEVMLENIDLCQPIHAFLKNTAEDEKDFWELKSLVSSRLNECFELSATFRPPEFLPVPLHSAIEQMRLDQNPVLVKIRDWAQGLGGRLKQAKSDAVRENALSISEKIVRFIQSRSPDVDNSHYGNIFLTKGYIGESFVVGREDELAHVRKIVNNWRLGFRGAVILSGCRFSGKSLFGELVAGRHFIGHTVRLSPNSNLQVGSRQMTTTTDLGEALRFIEKNSLGERQLIWLDDLELWSDAKLPLSQNVRRLCQAIDRLSDRLFFLVAMSNWAFEHLNRFHELNRVFQAEVNLDKMDAAEVRQAILIRHSAAHRSLVDEEGEEVSPQQFQRMCERIFRSAHGNIGDSLAQWSAATRRMDDERVIHRPGPGHPLPAFLHPDSRILLRTLILGKRSNEYTLRRTFGPAFKDKYAGILQRLLRTGLLTRQMDGQLEVNEVAVNELGRMVFGK